MRNYVFAYYGEPMFRSAEDGARYKEKWRAWVGGLGDALAAPVTPLGKPKTISSRGVSDGGGSDRLTGFSTVRAGNMDAALEFAKQCPHLEHGRIDVAEAMDMGM